MARPMTAAAVAVKNNSKPSPPPGRASKAAHPITRLLTGKIRQRQVLDAFAQIDRAKFLDISLRPHSGSDRALPIGHAQTTSQPLVIARMLEMLLKNAASSLPLESESASSLESKSESKSPPRRLLKTVLEIGAGCGYQSALLSLLCEKVVAVERVGALARQTAARLRAMGRDNIRVLHQDGFDGCPSLAPFDGVIVCAEHAAVPDKLVAQLSPGGALIMPLSAGGGARLVAVNAEGAIVQRRELVRFVPMLAGKC